jgi:hypothetical protein
MIPGVRFAAVRQTFLSLGVFALGKTAAAARE